VECYVAVESKMECCIYFDKVEENSNDTANVNAMKKVSK